MVVSKLHQLKNRVEGCKAISTYMAVLPLKREQKVKFVEKEGIDPSASRMLSERSTT